MRREQREGRDGKSREVLIFDDDAERDAYIEEHYPERRCSASPGLFDVDGGAIGVFMREVTLYPDAKVRPAYGG